MGNRKVVRVIEKEKEGGAQTMKEKRLVWGDITNNIVMCDNQKEEYLGYLKYERVGSYMHWCWYQAKDVRMSPGCLQEVRDKQKELWKLIRDEKTN